MNVGFNHPLLLVLLLLLPVFIRRLTSARANLSTLLRIAIAVLMVIALAGPRFRSPLPGRDVIVVVDRSDSCGTETAPLLREILPLVRQAGGREDRVAVVAFADGAWVERGFGSDAAGPALDDLGGRSDLSAGLALAAGIRDPSRRTAILCLSDGKYTGEPPVEAILSAGPEAIPVWYRRTGLNTGLDVAAGDVVVPARVQPRSVWPVAFSIHANAPCKASFSLARNGIAIDGGRVRLERGWNRFVGRDKAGDDGELHEYRLDVDATGDAVRGNNQSTALVRVVSPPRVLLVSHRGEPGFLAEVLTAASIPVDHVTPARFPDSSAQLTPYRLVVLENCQLSAMPAGAVRALTESLRAGVSSLLITGGANSLGMGGYHRSLLDPLLPVELELRNETRRNRVAVAMALDRSGSMAAPAGPGRTKMDMANLGAAESILLLSPEDEVSVIAVDSSAHIIVPLSLADDAPRLARTTRTIEAMGGGIYCRTAIEAAAREIEKSTINNRHIILFADASDAEEQEDCLAMARQLAADGVGLSVVALGRGDDADAAFLRQLAGGGGEALFSDDAGGIPALFTQEMTRISRRGFIEEEVAPVLDASLATLGMEVEDDAPPPTLGGYNIASAREGALVPMRLDDEFHSPLLVLRQQGLASVGILLFEVEGEFAGSFPRWRHTPELLISLVRRLMPGGGLSGVKAYSALRRGVAEARFEFTPEAAAEARQGQSLVRWLGPGGLRDETPLLWTDPETAVSRKALRAPGHYLPVGLIGRTGVADAPPVSLAHSPEFGVDGDADGAAVLRRLAQATGGDDALDVGAVWRSAKAARTPERDMSLPLMILILILYLVEVALRRLGYSQD